MPDKLPMMNPPRPVARPLRRLIAPAGAALMLAACAVAPQRPAPGPAAPAIERTLHDTLDAGGRLSVHYQRNGQDEALHGNFAWNQTPQRTTVTLLSPLGQTMAIIDILPDRAMLTQANQPPRVAADVDTLTAQALGWPLPVSGLRQWLQGEVTDASGRRIVASPASDAPVTTADGWTIRYVSWNTDDATPHPKRIDLQRHTEQAGDVAIRIVIDDWQAK